MACSVEISNNAQGPTNTRGRPIRRATARVLPGAPRSATDYSCRHCVRGYRSWDVLGGWRSPEVPRRQQRRGYRYRLLSEVVAWSVLMWFGRQRGTKNWVCDGREFFKAPQVVYFVLGGIGPHAAAAPVVLPLENDGSRL